MVENDSKAGLPLLYRKHRTFRDAPLDFHWGSRKFCQGVIFFFALTGCYCCCCCFRHLHEGDFFFWKCPPPKKKIPWRQRVIFFRTLTGAIFFHPHGEGDFFFFKKLPTPPPGNLMVRPLHLNVIQSLKCITVLDKLTSIDRLLQFFGLL